MMIRARPCLGYSRSFHGVAPPSHESLYSEKPLYPPLPRHPGNTYLTQKEAIRENMKALDTVEEKAYYLNLPKYYGWFSTSIQENNVRYGTLGFAQSSTATDVTLCGEEDVDFPVKHSPESKAITASSLDLIFKYIQNTLRVSRPLGSFKRDALNNVIDFKAHKKLQMEHLSFLKGLDRILSTQTNNTFTTDVFPRLEAFWFKGGIHPDRRMVKKRRGTVETRLKRRELKGTLEDHKDTIFEPYERALAYNGTPLLTKRHSSFLPSFLPMEECLRSFEEEEEFLHDPRSLGFPCTHVRGRNIPAVWSGSSSPCLNISFLSSLNKSKNLSTQTCFSEGHMSPDDEALVKTLFHSFASCLSSSTYFGFSPFNNPTYPISTRSMVFDGSSLALSAYQLNRTELHQNQPQEEGRNLRNRLWFRPYRELFTLSEEGTLGHLNEELLEDLVAIYLESGVQMSEDSAAPYLNPEIQYIHQLKSTYDRAYFWKQYLSMNNPHYMNNIRRPETQPWEKIHLIDNPSNLSAIGLRERQWFLMAKYDFRGREHWDPEFRKLDYYEPPYLPVKFRKDRNPFKVNQYRTRKVTIPVPKDSS
eukprot:TRINITY_DN18173_c0_g1_i1.p1 TRINITY_DN18173_c0_g1~~TRINITY_DN18173_c0_g1_i1.p1  ORF type:complete len:588 (-),score=190.63 TRINITY_DN18173_c0_g1_i1:385-2148(-)